MNTVVGERIKKLRTEAGLSQEELAKIIGVKNRSSIANYEAGRLSPDYCVLTAVASYFNVTTDYLLGLTNEKQVKAKVSFELANGEIIDDLGKMMSELEPSDQDLLVNLLLSLKKKAEANKK